MIGIFVFVGNFGQIQIVAADIANALSVNDAIPAILNAYNISFFIPLRLVDLGIGSAGSGANLHSACGNCAVAQFSVCCGGNLHIITVNVAFFQVVNNFVPVVTLTDDHDNFTFFCIVDDFGIGICFTAQSNTGAGNETDTIDEIASRMCIHGNGTDKQHHSQKKADNSVSNFHTLPSVLGN